MCTKAAFKNRYYQVQNYLDKPRKSAAVYLLHSQYSYFSTIWKIDVQDKFYELMFDRFQIKNDNTLETTVMEQLLLNAPPAILQSNLLAFSTYTCYETIKITSIEVIFVSIFAITSNLCGSFCASIDEKLFNANTPSIFAQQCEYWVIGESHSCVCQGFTYLVVLALSQNHTSHCSKALCRNYYAKLSEFGVVNANSRVLRYGYKQCFVWRGV